MKVVGPIYDFLKNINQSRDYKTVLLYGGASSGKSKTMYRYIIAQMLTQPGIKNFIFRKYGPSIQSSTFADCLEVLHELDIFNDVIIIRDKSERTLTFKNGSQIIFKSLDSQEKVKSIDMNNVIFEEANEFTVNDYNQIKLRTRRHNKYGRNRIYLLFNPVSKANWLYTEFFEKTKKDAIIHKSTYRDNPFLPKEIVEDIESFKIDNPEWFQIYGNGEFGNFQGAIYTHINIIKPINKEMRWDSVFYGIDWGFRDPLAFIKIGVKDKVFFIIDEFYKTEKTTGDLIKYMENSNVSRNDYIYCDSANPDRIEDLTRAGFNAKPAIKGKDSIKNGIDKLKMQKIHLYNNCYYTIKEVNSYRWKEDRDGNILDEPEDANNHSMDAIRYAITSYLGTDNNIYVAPTKDHLSSKFKGFPK